MGNLLVLQCEEYYLLELKISLFRPQTYLNSQKNGRNRMESNNSYLDFTDGARVTIVCHPQTALPMFRAFMVS